MPVKQHFPSLLEGGPRVTQIIPRQPSHILVRINHLHQIVRNRYIRSVMCELEQSVVAHDKSAY